jgi:hypothetical protein
MYSHLPSVLYCMAHSLSGMHCSGQCHTNWVPATEAETTHSHLVLSSSSGTPGTLHPVTLRQTCHLWWYVLFCSSAPRGTKRRDRMKIQCPSYINYSKTIEVGHPCKSATCHSWPHFLRNQQIPMTYVVIIP